MITDEPEAIDFEIHCLEDAISKLNAKLSLIDGFRDRDSRERAKATIKNLKNRLKEKRYE